MVDPKSIHKLDQETGPMHEFAYKLAAYRRSLIEQGFSEADAIRLVESYQAEVVRSILGK